MLSLLFPQGPSMDAAVCSGCAQLGFASALLSSSAVFCLCIPKLTYSSEQWFALTKHLSLKTEHLL